MYLGIERPLNIFFKLVLILSPGNLETVLLMEDGGIGREDTFSLSLENEILLGRKPLEKQLTHSSTCDNPTVVMLLGSQRAWIS